MVRATFWRLVRAVNYQKHTIHLGKISDIKPKKIKKVNMCIKLIIRILGE